MNGGRSVVMAATLAITACVGVGQVPGEAPSSWPAAVREFTAPEQVLAVAGHFPNSAGMQRRRLGAALQAGDAAGALDALRRLAAMGAVLSAANQAQVTPLVGAGAMAPISARMAANAAPRVASSIHTTIPASHQLVEGIVWDSTARRLFATTVVDRNLLLLGPDAVSVAASGGFGSLLGGAYDPVRRRIWIASAVVESAPRDGASFVGLVSIDPGNPGDVRRISAPPGPNASPGDVAIAADGIVYASDGLSGAIYRCRPGCAALEILLAPGTLFSAQGMALSGDQRLLYIADRRYGLAALDRATGRLYRVAGADDMMLDGIDALAAYRGGLVGTQTAYAPARIVRLRLSRDGLRVTGLDVLERANPDWSEITLVAIAGNRLLYVADAQWDRYGEGGLPNAQMPARATAIRSLPLP